MAFVSIAIVEIAAAFISTVLAIGLAWQGWGYWSLVSRPIILGLITTLGVWLFCRWRPRRPIRKSGVRPMLKFGANTLIGNLFDYVTLNLDKTLIGRKYGSDQIGYYQRAVYLSKIASDTLTMSLINVAVATLSKLRNEPDEYRRFYLKGLSVISFVGMPISIFMFMMSRDLVRVILGPQWDQTATIFSALGLSTGLYMIYNTNGWLHLSLGRSDRFKRWAIFATAVYVVAIFIGLSIGVLGVAVAYTTATFLLMIPCLLYAGKPIGLKLIEILSNLWRFFFAAIVPGLICRYVLFRIIYTHYTLMNIIIYLAIYASIYLVLIISIFGSPRPIMEFFHLLRGIKRHI
jgi:PST family polysaccharide transporter